MTLTDIGIYKNKMIAAFLQSKDISELLLGRNYEETDLKNLLLYHHLFPYLYSDETETASPAYICFEVDVDKTSVLSYKNMKITL